MSQPAAALPPSVRAFPLILFSYMLLIEAVLLALAFWLTGGQEALRRPVTATDLWPFDAHPELVTTCYGVGLMTLALAWILPPRLARRPNGLTLPGAGGHDPLSRAIGPYIVRLCLAESTAVAGFVLAILGGGALAMLPLWGLGVLTTLAATPTTGQLARLSGGVAS